MNMEFLWPFKSMIETIKANAGAPWLRKKVYNLHIEESVTTDGTITDHVLMMQMLWRKK